MAYSKMSKIEGKVNTILHGEEEITVNPIETKLKEFGRIYPIEIAKKENLRLGLFMTVKFFERTVKDLGLRQRGFNQDMKKLMSSEVEKR